jgi:hypothetical protein
MDLLLWNVVVLEINKCTVEVINTYRLFIIKCGAFKHSNCTVADINSYGFVVMKCGGFTH